MTSALLELRKGWDASLLQTSASQTLRNNMELPPAVSEGERSTLVIVLETADSS